MAKTDQIMTPKEAAQYLKVSYDFLERDRWTAKAAGLAPRVPYSKIGKHVRYRLADLENFINSHMQGA